MAREDTTASGHRAGWVARAQSGLSAAGSYRPPRSMRIHRVDGRSEIVGLDAELDYRFGRSPENTVSFEGDETVSRMHGLLSCDANGAWFYADQRSRNGSFVMSPEEFGRREFFVDRLLRPYEHVRVAAGDLVLFAKGRSRVELLAEPARPEASARTRWASEAGRKLEAQLGRAARHDACVFLLGPSGAGKTYVAQQIHMSSKRRAATFLPLNCGRLPKDPTALHSELLGHVAGAFTGASSARLGALASAAGGTVFLDEVESLPPEGQAFLLDIVERSGPLRPLGASPRSQPLELDLRFISASKVPLEESGLRHDLAERLSAYAIAIPALEERREDLPVLVALLMKDLRWPGGAAPKVEREAMALLAERSYRGQIRELRDALGVVGQDALAAAEELGLAASKAAITRVALADYFEGRNLAHERRHKTLIIPAPRAAAPITTPPRKRPEDLTRDELDVALRKVAGNQTHAADALGISVNTLKAKMRVFRLRREDYLPRG